MDQERFQKSVSLKDSGNYEEALREMEELASVETDEQYKGALLLGQARCLSGLGRLEEARQRLTESARIWNNPYTELVDAYLCTDEGKKEDAMRKLMLFLETYDSDLKEPGNEDTYSEASERLGYLLFEAKRYADAIPHLNQALAFPETDARKRQLCFYLGVSHLEAGNITAAERELVQSLPPRCEDPLWAEAHFQLGRLYYQQGAYLNAKAAFESCEFSSDEADPELRQKISEWLAAVRARLPAESRERRSPN